MNVVFDANVVISGAAWKGEAYLCLAKAARRRLIPFASEFILGEIQATARRLDAQKLFPIPPWPVLLWYAEKAKMIEPLPLAKSVSRDPKDDVYIGCALAAGACLVTYDHDLLDLGKPFGVPVLRPSQVLKELSR